MKTKRLRGIIKDFLKSGPKSTPEILEHVNIRCRHGTTSQQMCNVLSKDNDIVKVGQVRRKGARYGSYNVCEWALKDPSKPDTEEDRRERWNRIVEEVDP